MNTPPPNILFLFSDQHNAFTDRMDVGTSPRTPNLDRLRMSGANFSNAYCNSPICAPSRCSLLSGRLPSELGAIENDDRLSPMDPTFVHGLAAAGYRTALCGKMHFLDPDYYHGFQENLLGEPGIGLFGGLKLPTPFPRGWNETGPNPLIFSGYGKQGYVHYDREVARRCEDFLVEQARLTANRRPFFLLAGFILPHNPYVCSEEAFHFHYPRINPVKLEARLRKTSAHDEYLGIFLKINGIENVPLELHRRTLAAYFGLCEELDKNVGRILNALDSHDGLKNTVVIYSSDHGDHCAANGLWYKSSLAEDSIRVPMVIRGPGIATGDRQRVVGLTDLAATIAELAGAEKPPRATGNGFSDVLYDSGTDSPGEAVCESSGRAGAGPLWCMRSGPWKYTHCHHPELEILCHLGKDPGETLNLAGLPEHHETLMQFRSRRLSAWNPEDVLNQWKIRNKERSYLEAAGRIAVKTPPTEIACPPLENVFEISQLPETIRAMIGEEKLPKPVDR